MTRCRRPTNASTTRSSTSSDPARVRTAARRFAARRSPAAAGRSFRGVAARLGAAQGAQENARRAAHAGLYAQSLDRAVACARTALHAGVAVGDARLLPFEHQDPPVAARQARAQAVETHLVVGGDEDRRTGGRLSHGAEPRRDRVTHAADGPTGLRGAPAVGETQPRGRARHVADRRRDASLPPGRTGRPGLGRRGAACKSGPGSLHMHRIWHLPRRSPSRCAPRPEPAEAGAPAPQGAPGAGEIRA